jgi:pimeloyl-ACP methyl ester carboxylesterase
MKQDHRFIAPALALLLSLSALPPAQSEPVSSATASTPAAVHETLLQEPVFGGRVFIARAGVGNERTIVLVHGMGDQAARDWEGVVPELARNYHVVLFDLPGFGRSDKGNLLYSPARYAALIDWIADRYAGKQFILAGHSMGGALALTYASLYPDRVARLILVDAAGVLHHVSLGKELLSSKGAANGSGGTPIDALMRRALDNFSSGSRRTGWRPPSGTRHSGWLCSRATPSGSPAAR